MSATAEIYTGVNPDGSTAYSEELVGKALAPYREKVQIATKCGIVSMNGLYMELDASREHIRKSVEGSLKKLKTDHIDLYYLHRVDPKVPIEDVAETMSELIREGKILHWGVSNVGEDIVRRADKVCHLTAVQNLYNMLNTGDDALLPVLEELNIGYVPFSPLGNGFLSAAYKATDKFDSRLDFRSFLPQYTEEGFNQNKALLEVICDIANTKKITPAQVSLAWVMAKKPFILPIPGTRKAHRLEENCGAADVKLTADEISALDAEIAKLPAPHVWEPEDK